jgi:hypothetical protein
MTTNISYNLENDGQEYLIELQPCQLLEPDKDFNGYHRVLQFLMRNAIKDLQLESLLVPNQVFDPQCLEDFTGFSFHMWPGWNFKLYSPLLGPSATIQNQQRENSNYFLNLRSIHQVIRLETVLEKLLMIRELSLEQGLDYQEEIFKVFRGIKVVSKYNNKCYYIKEVCFDMNTESTFEMSHENELFQVSFFDYFTKRYGQQITQIKQPMIKASKVNPLKQSKDEKTVEDDEKCCYLVPELCHLVGITDQMRNKKMLWS